MARHSLLRLLSHPAGAFFLQGNGTTNRGLQAKVEEHAELRTQAVALQDRQQRGRRRTQVPEHRVAVRTSPQSGRERRR